MITTNSPTIASLVEQHEFTKAWHQLLVEELVTRDTTQSIITLNHTILQLTYDTTKDGDFNQFYDRFTRTHALYLFKLWHQHLSFETIRYILSDLTDDGFISYLQKHHPTLTTTLTRLPDQVNYKTRAIQLQRAITGSHLQNSLTTILSLAATHSWNLTGIDVENAFVEADIDRPIFMKLPKSTYGNKNGSPVIVELKKSLYGLKQAPELWDKFLVSAIQKQGFSQLMHDQCVFIKRTTHNEIIILIKYVDDIILTGNSQPLIQSTLKEFEHSCFIVIIFVFTITIFIFIIYIIFIIFIIFIIYIIFLFIIVRITLHFIWNYCTSTQIWTAYMHQ